MTEQTTTTAVVTSENVVAKAPASFRVLLGYKKGVTQVFTDDGRLRPATVIEAGPCTVLRVKSREKDGYAAVQLGFKAADERRLTKPVLGQFKAIGMAPAKHVREIRVADPGAFQPGQIVDLEGRFAPLDYVDVQGTSKGHGFQGVMKRHGFHGLPASHGASDKQRSPGSIAARRSLGRVLPGQRMAGRMGFETVTVQKIEVVKVEPQRHLLYVNGSVPGAVGTLVVVCETVKNRKRRIIRKASEVLRDKMGNIIQAKGAKAAAKAQAAAKLEKK